MIKYRSFTIENTFFFSDRLIGNKIDLSKFSLHLRFLFFWVGHKLLIFFFRFKFFFAGLFDFLLKHQQLFLKSLSSFVFSFKFEVLFTDEISSLNLLINFDYISFSTLTYFTHGNLLKKTKIILNLKIKVTVLAEKTFVSKYPGYYQQFEKVHFEDIVYTECLSGTLRTGVFLSPSKIDIFGNHGYFIMKPPLRGLFL